MDDQLRTVIADVHAPDEDVLEAISHLGRHTEKPAFWTQIADNTNYPTLHRARCVLALFRRYVQGEVDLPTVGSDIEPAKWLEQSTIIKFGPEDGLPGNNPIPVDFKEGDSIFQINVLDSWHFIYFRIKGEVTLEQFTSELKGGGENYLTSNKVPRLFIEQLGYVDDYDDWLDGLEYPGHQ